MKNIKSFTIYKEYYDLITLLNEEEQKEISLAMIRYMFDGIIPSLTDRSKKVFDNLKRPLDKSKNKSTNARKENQNEIKLKSSENQNEEQINNQNEIKEGNTTNVVNVNVNCYMSNIEELIKIFEDNGFILHGTPIETNILNYLLEIDKTIIEESINEAKMQCVYTINYVYGIIKNKLKKLSEEIGQPLPGWFDKKIEKIEEDLEELNDVLKDFE